MRKNLEEEIRIAREIMPKKKEGEPGYTEINKMLYSDVREQVQFAVDVILSIAEIHISNIKK